MSNTQYGAPTTEDVLGVKVLHLRPDQLLEVVDQIKADRYVSCVDLAGVDYLGSSRRNDLPPEVQPQRFEVAIAFISHNPPGRIRVRVQVPEDNLEVPTLFNLYPGVEALEREAFDMFGIIFTDHPNLTRILMPDSWEGYPLRKDFPVGEVPVQFSINVSKDVTPSMPSAAIPSATLAEARAATKAKSLEKMVGELETKAKKKKKRGRKK